MNGLQSRFLTLCFSLAALSTAVGSYGQSEPKAQTEKVNHRKAEREFKELLRNPATKVAVLKAKIKDCRFENFDIRDIPYLGHARQQILRLYAGRPTKDDVKLIMETAHKENINNVILTTLAVVENPASIAKDIVAALNGYSLPLPNSTLVFSAQSAAYIEQARKAVLADTSATATPQEAAKMIRFMAQKTAPATNVKPKR